MAHKALVNGTAYEVTGGKALVDGTAYSVTKGRTLVGGTGYDVSFGGWRARFIRLMQNATVVASAGRNSSTENRVRIYASSLPQAGTYYFFILLRKKVSIVKIVYDGTQATKTDLFSQGDTVVIDNSGVVSFDIGYYRNGVAVTDTGINGGGMFAFQFTGFLEANIDSLLSAFTIQNAAGGDWYDKDYVYVADTTTNALLVQESNYIALSFPYGTLIVGNYSYDGGVTIRDLLYHDNGYYYVSLSGTKRDNVYGANIIEL